MHVEHCRKLIGSEGVKLSTDQIQEIVAVTDALAGVIVDAWLDLDLIDQSKFYPPGDVIDQLNELQSQTENAE